jgi:hypothetical protein
MGVAMERLASCGAVYVTHAVSTKTYDVGFCPKSCCILGPVKKKEKTQVGLRIGKSRRHGKGFAVSCKVVEANVGVTTTSVKAPDVSPEQSRFLEACQKGNLVPVFCRIFSDHMTPVIAYRCLVKEDDREAPSFLFESVENGQKNCKYGPIQHGGCTTIHGNSGKGESDHSFES